MDVKLHIVKTEDLFIYEQLQLEEALIRTSDENFCFINSGSPPAIVMGISGQPAELIDYDAYKKTPIPIIKRFSGGGTVVVDQGTIFVTFLFQKNAFPSAHCPKSVLEWSENMYQGAFVDIPFQLRENDYIIRDKKIGGNAQYFVKNAWLHHTSFLFDYSHERMNLLQMPKKKPLYRENRDHTSFCDKLCTAFTTKDAFVDAIIDHLQSLYSCIHISLEQAKEKASPEHRKSVQFVEF